MTRPWYYLIAPYGEGAITKEWLGEQEKVWGINTSYEEYDREPTHYFIRFSYRGFTSSLIVEEDYGLRVTTIDKHTMEELRNYTKNWIELKNVPAGTTIDSDPSVNPRQWIIGHLMKLSNNFNIEPLIE